VPAEFLLRGRPLGLANAPSSRARSCRIGWTRLSRPTSSVTMRYLEPASSMTRRWPRTG